MKRIISFVLFLLMLISLSACDGNNDINEYIEKTEVGINSDTGIGIDSVADTGVDADITIGKEEADVFEIQTDYCILKYPSKWADVVSVNVSDEVVSFVHKETGIKVFDIIFGENGDLIGVLKTDSQETEVRIVSYDLDETNSYYDIMRSIEFDVNVIINHLSNDYTFWLGN